MHDYEASKFPPRSTYFIILFYPHVLAPTPFMKIQSTWWVKAW
jgi:hypothetical protein